MTRLNPLVAHRCAMLTASALLCTAGRADDLFEPPADADVAALIKSIDQLSHPSHEPESREAAEAYARKAAAAIVEIADRVLQADATDGQLIRAIESKYASLHLLEGMGVAGDRPSADEFLNRFQDDERPSVSLAVLRIRMADRIAHWETLCQREQRQTLDKVAAVLQRSPATVDHIRLLLQIADVLGESPSRGRVLELVADLRPKFEASKDPAVAEKLSSLDGIVARLNLPGEPIEVEGKLLSGKLIDWEDYRGKVVLIDYWATWCGMCRAEFPNIRRLHEEFGDDGFVVLGVSLDENKERVQQFLAANEIPWKTLFGHDETSRGWNHPMVDKYGIHDLPRAILVDRQGRVVDVNARGEELASRVQEMFAKDTPVASKKHSSDGLRVASDP